ncbi:hypothetical protein JCM4914_24880 [Streptomyces platensis subsp. malvinus]
MIKGSLIGIRPDVCRGPARKITEGSLAHAPVSANNRRPPDWRFAYRGGPALSRSAPGGALGTWERGESLVGGGQLVVQMVVGMKG